MSDSIQELIGKLEAAEVGSFKLDALIWLRLNRPEYKGGVIGLEMRTWHDGRGHMILETDDGEEVADHLDITAVTTSLDAALALAERVLPGVRVMTERFHDGKGWAMVQPVPESAKIMTDGSTPTLALCIAILKAQAEARV